MSGHTKGTWKTTPTASHVFIDNWEQGGVVCKMACRGDVLRWACEGASKENTANAHLISAAPDLLEACYKALEVTGGSHNWNGETNKFLKMIEAAVGKAVPEVQ